MGFASVVLHATVLVGLVHGHCSVIMPPSRNAIDGVMPGTPWSGGKHPPTGSIMPYGSSCTNSTSVDCNNGQSAFWFSQGCTIGCNECTGNGSRLPNFDHCPSLPKPRADQLLHPEYRTTNQHTTMGSEDDFYKFNPWRAPGIAPVYDPCGMAGGSTTARFNAGEYNTTKYAKQEELTEACFQRTPLEFGPAETHVIRFADPTKDVTINATIVKKGGGKGWMKFPFPNYDNGQCDYVVHGGHHCGNGCRGCGAPLYAADKACPCDCSTQYPGLPEGNADPKDFPNQLPGHGNKDESKYACEDTLKVPTDIAPGHYVLGWRWDAEMTSQIWQSCSDITIV